MLVVICEVLFAKCVPFPFPVVDCHTHFTNLTLLKYQDDWVTSSFFPDNYSKDTTAVKPRLFSFSHAIGLPPYCDHNQTALPSSKVVFMEAAVLPELNVDEAK